MNIARRQFFRGLAVLAASPVAIAVAKVMPALEPTRARAVMSMRSIANYVPGNDQIIDGLDVVFGDLYIRPEWAVQWEGDKIGSQPHVRLSNDYHLS